MLINEEVFVRWILSCFQSVLCYYLSTPGLVVKKMYFVYPASKNVESEEADFLKC